MKNTTQEKIFASISAVIVLVIAGTMLFGIGSCIQNVKERKQREALHVSVSIDCRDGDRVIYKGDVRGEVRPRFGTDLIFFTRADNGKNMAVPERFCVITEK